MSKRSHADSGHQVEVFTAVYVVQTRAAAANERDRLPFVSLDNVPRFERLDVIQRQFVHRPEAIKARIAEQVTMLLDASERIDADRLHQEAILIASKADIREELDRLASHVAQIERLIGEGGPIGRRLDFLAQELNREANTLCSKSNDVELTNIGLELKSVVEQFREQVQNLE
jgi:uncharacterized protein (TIGR00255 family)